MRFEVQGFLSSIGWESAGRWDRERRTGDLVWCRRDKADAWHGLQIRFLTKSVVEMHNGRDYSDMLE
jgi:hypothetical protein